MNSYLINFATYTLAMIGFLAIAIFVYKKTVFTGASTRDKDFLRVESTMRLSATKTVYVIKAGREKFLIAGDAANTTMLAKLEDNFVEEESFIKNNMTGFSSESTILQKIGRG